MKIPWKVQQTMRKFSVENLMYYIIIGMAAVFVLDMVLPINLRGMLMFSRQGILSGQIWRLISFIILPPSTSMLWIIFSLYLYWMIGSVLENQMGTYKFNLFYWVGVLGSVIGGLITGYADNTFLNLSLYLAFAAMNPNYQFLLFFFLPVKVKYLALIEVVGYLYMFIVGSWSTRAMILFSLLNIILFFGGDLINTIRREKQYFKTRYNFRKSMKDQW